MRGVLFPLKDLALRHPGLTEAVGNGYCEAARVCLDRHHQPPQVLLIDNGTGQIDTVIKWDPTDSRTRAAWANDIDTTEAGAYACAIVAVELSEGFYAIRRAETKTGADYYVAPSSSSEEDLESSFRLEVSGTDAPDVSVVDKRLRQKVGQALKGKSNLPAIAAVVGFQVKLIRLERVDTP